MASALIPLLFLCLVCCGLLVVISLSDVWIARISSCLAFIVKAQNDVFYSSVLEWYPIQSLLSVPKSSVPLGIVCLSHWIELIRCTRLG